MNELGFVYVLANSAMPDMIKIGKTTRSTSERAEELSKATGLPTPFIVVYEQLFEDCNEAEEFVHTHLEKKGHRVSANREFFNCPVSVAVKAIALAPNAIDSSGLESMEDEDGLFESSELDELDDLCLGNSDITYPWSDVFDEAEAYYYGLYDYIVDYTEALLLYRQAAKLGSLPAYSNIGRIYEYGYGVRKDNIKALKFYKEGARKGSAACYWRMGILFATENNITNAEKCFALFLKNKPKNGLDDQVLTNDDLDSIFLDCCYEILLKQKESGQEYPVLHGFISDNHTDILSTFDRIKEIDCNNSSMVRRWHSAIAYLNTIIS